jgi:hypothetical protein
MELITGIYRMFKKLNSWRINNLMKKRANETNRNVSKEQLQMRIENWQSDTNEEMPA